MSIDLAFARLLQLASPTLPVGAYSYSQGLEAAVEAGIVHDAASARSCSPTSRPARGWTPS